MTARHDHLIKRKERQTFIPQCVAALLAPVSHLHDRGHVQLDALELNLNVLGFGLAQELNALHGGRIGKNPRTTILQAHGREPCGSPWGASLSAAGTAYPFGGLGLDTRKCSASQSKLQSGAIGACTPLPEGQE